MYTYYCNYITILHFVLMVVKSQDDYQDATISTPPMKVTFGKLLNSLQE